MSEFEKMRNGVLFNPADKSVLITQILSEIRQRRFNRTPIFFIGRRDRLFKRLIGSLGGRPYNIVSPFTCVYGINIHVGKNFFANTGVFMQDYAEIKIDDNVMLGPNVSLVTVWHPERAVDHIVQTVPNSIISGSRGNFELARPIHICDNVLIYTGTIVCGGVTIGANSIIGAGSIVDKDIPPNVVAYGSPCRVIREIKNNEI